MVKAVCSSWRKTTSKSRQKFHSRVLLFWWSWSWCAAAHELWVFRRHWSNWGFKLYVMIWGMIVELQLVGHRVLLLYLKIYVQCNHLTGTHVHKYVIKDLIHHVKNLALDLTPPAFLQQLLPPPLTWALRESDGLRVPVLQPPVWGLLLEALHQAKFLTLYKSSFVIRLEIFSVFCKASLQVWALA
jgi:hypothetical protein